MIDLSHNKSGRMNFDFSGHMNTDLEEEVDYVPNNKLLIPSNCKFMFRETANQSMPRPSHSFKVSVQKGKKRDSINKRYEQSSKYLKSLTY